MPEANTDPLTSGIYNMGHCMWSLHTMKRDQQFKKKRKKVADILKMWCKLVRKDTDWCL